MTLALAPRPTERTDTFDLIPAEPPRGRHAATRKAGQELPGQLSVGFLCMVAGHRAPVRTADRFAGRHATAETDALA